MNQFTRHRVSRRIQNRVESSMAAENDQFSRKLLKDVISSVSLNTMCLKRDEIAQSVDNLSGVF